MAQDKKVAIVTGGSRGIGREIALELSKDGFAVVINYAQNVDEAESLKKQIEGAGGEALAVKADIGESKDVTRLFDEAIARFGRVDALVNNAGIITPDGMTVQKTTDDWAERTVKINLLGSFYAMREAAEKIKDGGRIVNLSSSLAKMRAPGYGIYSATKSAVETLTSTLAKEMRGRNVTVNVVGPGPVATDLFLKGKTEEQIKFFSAANPMQRLGTPQDIAKVVAFLLSDGGGWINGQTVYANGGMI